MTTSLNNRSMCPGRSRISSAEAALSASPANDEALETGELRGAHLGKVNPNEPSFPEDSGTLGKSLMT
jgi:hypothetical protein